MKQLLKKISLSTRDFSKAIRVPQFIVNKWLKGKSKPTYKEQQRISKIFGISFDEIQDYIR